MPEQAVDEYKVKAAYLYNFAIFVEWPASAFQNDFDPISYCVLGDNPFGEALREALEGKAVENRTLVLRQISDAKQAKTCHVLFIGSLDHKRVHTILQDLKPYNILTVGETQDFAAEGGVARFLLEAGRVRLEFNVDSAEDAKIHISPKLLNLGRIIRRPGK